MSRDETTSSPKVLAKLPEDAFTPSSNPQDLPPLSSDSSPDSQLPQPWAFPSSHLDAANPCCSIAEHQLLNVEVPPGGKYNLMKNSCYHFMDYISKQSAWPDCYMPQIKQKEVQDVEKETPAPVSHTMAELVENLEKQLVDFVKQFMNPE